MGKMIHEELSRSIIGIALEVLNELKPGLDEELYERANDHRAEAVRPSYCGAIFLAVHFRGELIGNLVPDLIIDGPVFDSRKPLGARSAFLVLPIREICVIRGQKNALHR